MNNQIHRRYPWRGAAALLLTAAALLLVAWSVVAAPAAPTGPVDGEPATLIPLGPDQGDTYRAYRALFEHLGREGRLRWEQAAFTHAGVDYAPGAALVPEAELTGPFSHILVPSGTLDLRPALAIAPLRVALFRSSVTDTHGGVNWELGAVREVFDNYLWGAVPNDVLSEDEVRAGDLADYDLLVLPGVKIGAAFTVTQELGPEGLAAIDSFVRNGGSLYTQGNAAYVAEAAGLVPPGTVALEERITAPGDTAHLNIALPDHPLALSWLTDAFYVLGDPLLIPGPELTAVATFTDGTWPDMPAILSGLVGNGRVTLVAGHPTDRDRREQLPLFLDALLLAGAEHGELYGRAAQAYNPALPPDLLPAWESVAVSVTLTLADLGLEPLTGVLVTETVEPGFVVTESAISPAPFAVTYEILPGPLTRTHILWDLGDVDPGQVELTYLARTAPESLAQGRNILFSTGQAAYTDAADGRAVTVTHFPFRLSSQMAARLEGDRDIELDRAYTIPEEGNYFDVAAVLENKEWTAAEQVVITDVVPLIAPIVALDNQYRVLAANDGETVWMRNEVYFYDDDRYPLPVGYTTSDTITLADWDGVTVYTYTSPGGYHIDPPLKILSDTGSFVTIPPTYTAYITVTPRHELVLPAIVLTWTEYYTTGFPGYEYKEPAIRYGLNSRELLSRSVSFSGDPLTGTVVVDATGGSVYTNLGGHPIFYRDYLSAAMAYAPASSVPPGVGYLDIWNRPHSMPFRAAFYDVFDWASCTSCPGRMEQHAALNVTFGLWADTDRDGQRDELVQRAPTRLEGTDLNLLIKSRNLGYSIAWDENLIDEGIFRGLGYRIEPRNGDPNGTREERWRQSYESNFSDMVEFTQTLGYDHLFFQQDLPPGATNLITIQAEILPYSGLPKEGMMKLHDGARLTYRQQWAGPNRYEVYDTHVQGVVGERSDARVRKQVAPIEVSTYGDQVCYLFTVDDPYDPRIFSEDPYLLSYGYGDLAATTYVGGVEKQTLLHSLVAPGEWTRVRIEVNNNSGVTFTNVVLTPQPPAGVTFTPIYQEAAGGGAIPPIFWDLPFLWAETIPDAWKGVYYYSVTVDADLDPALLGTVQEMPIAIGGDNVPADFELSPAVLGIEDESGQARHTYGQAHDLLLTDWAPDKIRVLPDGAARVDEAGWDQFQECVALGGDPPDCLAALPLTWPIEVYTETVGAGTQLAFALTDDDALLPRPDGEALRIIALADLLWASSGSNVINAGPVITYTDPFGMNWQHQAPPVDVEAHGALIVAGYRDLEIGPEGDYLVPQTENFVDMEAIGCNIGDRKADDVQITLTLPLTIEIVSVGPEVTIVSNTLAWGGFDLAPGGCSQPVTFTVSVQPDLDAVGGDQPIVNAAWAVFWDAYSAQAVSGPAGGGFWLPVKLGPDFVYHTYLPTVLKKFSWWPPLSDTNH